MENKLNQHHKKLRRSTKDALNQPKRFESTSFKNIYRANIHVQAFKIFQLYPTIQDTKNSITLSIIINGKRNVNA